MRLNRSFVLRLMMVLVLFTTIPSAASTAIATTAPAITFPIPTTLQITHNMKKAAGGGASLAIYFAVDQLLDGIDWVMDPANNQAILKNNLYCEQNSGPCTNDLMGAQAYALTTSFYTDWKYPFKGCRFEHNWGNGMIVCSFEKDGDIRGVFFHNQGQKTASYEQIANQIIKNAKAGHQPSIDYLNAIADEIARQNKPKEDGRPKPTTKPDERPKDDTKLKEGSKPKKEPKEYKTCSKDYIQYPRCAYLNGFKYPSKSSAIAAKLTGLRSEKKENYNSFCRSYGTHEKFFPNKKKGIQTPRGHYGASLSSCKCCQDSSKGAYIDIKWRVD